MKKCKSSRKEIITEILNYVSPGTDLRSGLDMIQEAGFGALILLSDPLDVEGFTSGGFRLDSNFTPQKLYELSKMDGGIILSKEIDIIHYANVQLQPDPSIPTDESGTRHRTAERIANQTNNFVITVSERRNKITIYKGSFKYSLSNIEDLIIKANQATMALEKYSTAIVNFLENLTNLEFDNMVDLGDIIEGIKKYIVLFKIADELEEYILELGNEGRLIVMQYKEVMANIKDSLLEVIYDYKKSKERSEEIANKLLSLTDEESSNEKDILFILGYKQSSLLDDRITTKGFRILNGIKRITKKDVEILMLEYKNFANILLANEEELSKIKGITKVKANYIRNKLLRLRDSIEMSK